MRCLEGAPVDGPASDDQGRAGALAVSCHRRQKSHAVPLQVPAVDTRDDRRSTVGEISAALEPGLDHPLPRELGDL